MNNGTKKHQPNSPKSPSQGVAGQGLKQKPTLSLPQILSISMGFMGIQFGLRGFVIDGNKHEFSILDIKKPAMNAIASWKILKL